MIEKGIVRKVEREFVIVEAERGSMCSMCPSKGLCHPFGDKKVLIKALNTANASIGDTVIVKLDDSLVLRATFVSYGLPVLAVIFSALILFSLFGDSVITAWGTVAGCFLSFLFVRLYDRRNIDRFIPEAVEIVDEGSCN